LTAQEGSTHTLNYSPKYIIMTKRQSLILNLALCITTALATTDDVSLNYNVIEWLRSNGGYFNHKQEIRREVPGNDTTPLGVFALQRIEKGDVLHTIPWKCILTAGTDIITMVTLGVTRFACFLRK